MIWIYIKKNKKQKKQTHVTVKAPWEGEGQVKATDNSLPPDLSQPKSQEFSASAHIACKVKLVKLIW